MAASSVLRLGTKLLMITVFLGWILVWVLRPTRNFTNKFMNPVIAASTTKVYGGTGSYTLIYTAPVLFLAFVAAIYLTCTRTPGIKKAPNVNPWTYPVFVRGPLSLISAGELAVLAAFVILYTWTTSKHLANSFSRINMSHGGHTMMMTKMNPLWERKFSIIGGRLGAAGAVPFAFLFFPVARLSSLLQLVNVPFEHAVRYHIWTAHIMMIIWSAHSIVYLIYWPIADKWREFITWEKTGISGLSGLLVWIVGLLIWATSLGPVRKHKFELFYYTHQLYMLFIIGFVLHVGERWLSMMVAGIFLFFIDRLLRFLQSRKHVDVLSASLISTETMELTIAKLPSLEYPPASTIFLNIPELSRLQWHPFTLTSCSSVDVDYLSVLIKCNGRWTQKVRDLLEKHVEKERKLDVAVEGPYGHSLDYLETYKVMIFVAGGSGISPFISIIKDLLHKVQTKQITSPEKIALIWSVKKADELAILSSISPSKICPDFVNDINLEVQVYVTQEEEPDLESYSQKGADHHSLSVVRIAKTKAAPAPTSAVHAEPSPNSTPLSFNLNKTLKVRGVTGISGNKLYAAVIVASFAGYMFLAGLIHGLYIFPIDHNTFKVYSRSGRGFLSLLEYMLGVCVFGGSVALVWGRWNSKGKNVNEFAMVDEASEKNAVAFLPSKVQYGSRPEIRGILSEYASRKGNHIGVFACGPLGLQEDVGFQCRELVLSFHPLNYEL